MTMSMASVPSRTYSDTRYNSLYIRYTPREPGDVASTGFRNMGHFYAYAVGRYVSIAYGISRELNLRYSQEEILEAALDSMRKRRHFYGTYAYAFTYGNTAYIDPCDSVNIPDISGEDLNMIKGRLRGKENVTLADIEKEIKRRGDAIQPVMIRENIPPEHIIPVWDEDGNSYGGIRELDALLKRRYPAIR
jgi:hypothetical protein